MRLLLVRRMMLSDEYSLDLREQIRIRMDREVASSQAVYS